MKITFYDIWRALFPANRSEKYNYLGAIPSDGYDLFDVLFPLILLMDYYAKPKWCPRWVLRLLRLLGSGRSVVYIRNYTLHDLHRKWTKGIFFYDYKTKWSSYDLRVFVSGNDAIHRLSDVICDEYYLRGHSSEMSARIIEINPNEDVRLMSYCDKVNYLVKHDEQQNIEPE